MNGRLRLAGISNNSCTKLPSLRLFVWVLLKNPAVKGAEISRLTASIQTSGIVWLSSAPPLTSTQNNGSGVGRHQITHGTRNEDVTVRGGKLCPVLHGSAVSRKRWGVGGTMDSESVLRSAGAPLLQVRTPPPAPCSDGELKT
ncbi:hypothetical protein PoB_003953200 [Plakobranchus ocellatus]|uniref:Uncharacterized protein n=1 Tax=Plakobranchus ocellatus TaxID=259542 RepID=A0AAV4B0J0_9GAST|nr:hypothetical protein PoB_003953200 [Plakobranchus ocellatus]